MILGLTDPQPKSVLWQTKLAGNKYILNYHIIQLAGISLWKFYSNLDWTRRPIIKGREGLIHQRISILFTY